MSRNESDYLRAMLNRVFDDGNFFAYRGLVRDTTDNNWIKAKEFLTAWQELGYLKILADPETLEDTQICVELFAHIPPPEKAKPVDSPKGFQPLVDRGRSEYKK